MNNILVLGGTGMLGQNLQQEFSKHNLTGKFVGSENGRYDLTNLDKTDNLFQQTKPDTVVFLAANVGGIQYNIKNPGKLIGDNLKIGINVLDSCLKYNVQQIYMTSTCCSYPKYCPVPFKETDLYNGEEEYSNSFYGQSKKTIMKMSQGYRKQYGLKTTCFILANLFGLYDSFDASKNHVVPALIKKFDDAVENNASEVRLWGTGNISRDLFYSQNCAEVLTKAIMTNFDHDQPINLGTGKEIYIKDLAYLIAELTGFKGEIVYTGEVSDGQPRRQLDCSRAKQLLDWEATTDLRPGLIKTIEWYRNNKK